MADPDADRGKGRPSLAPLIAVSRRAALKRWLMRLDYVAQDPPNDMSFGEIDAALDQLQVRIDECRKLYPFSKPTSPTDAILRHHDRHFGNDETKVPVTEVHPNADIAN
jgi:hypothetical protein